jgi:hypothetical protein
MADAKDLLEFLEGGIGMFFDVGRKLFRVKLAPFSPAGFGGEGAGLDGVQIPVNRTASQLKAPGGLGFGATGLNEFYHPFPQIQRIGFHPPDLTTLCTNVNVKCHRQKNSPAGG